MNEFELIHHYFNQKTQDPQILCGPGDDAAVIRPGRDKDLCISTDTLVAGVHFLESWPADVIAQKAVVVNVSDMAAMAANPKWISLALTMPQPDENWLALFSKGLFSTMQAYDVSLIGGDMTKGPLALTITIHGECSPDDIVYRNGARSGDLVFVTGELGAPALAVEWLFEQKVDEATKTYLMQRLQAPHAKVEYRRLLSRFATSCIDISDGLVGDLGHICQRSGAGALIDANLLPIDPVVLQIHPDKAMHYALHGGDEYQLCFTVKAEERQQMRHFAQQQGLPIYEIGTIMPEQKIFLKNNSHIEVIQSQSYQHF